MEGEIPEDWSLERLGALGSLQKGRGGPKRDGVPSGVPVVRYGELYTHHHDVIRNFQSFIPPERADDYTPLEKGDVLFAGAGETAEEIGKSAVFLGPEPAYGSGDMIIFRPDGRVDPLFLGYASNGRVANRHKVSVGQGSSIMHIYADDLESLELPLPPLPEQKKIAAILSSVDYAIAATRKVIEQTKRVKKGLLQDLMTQGVGHTRFKKTEIGDIPEEWEVVQVAKLLDSDGLRNGLSPRTVSWETDVLTFSIEALRDGVVSINEENTKYAAADPDEVQDYLLEPQDVLVMRGNANPELIGTAGIVEDYPEGVIYPDILIRVSLTDKVRRRFFVAMWNSSIIRRQIRQVAQTTSGTLKINQRQIRKIRFPLPSLKEQRRILNILDSVRPNGSGDLLGRLQALKRGLMQDLLTGRVRVSID